MIPTKITFKDFDESDAVKYKVQRRTEKLEQFYNRIIRCEVVLSCPHRHRHADRIFHVQILIELPGKDIVVGKKQSQMESHKNIFVAINDNFDAAERILQDHVRVMRGDVKRHSVDMTP